MKPLTKEHAEFLLQDVYLPMVKNESRTTLAVLQAIPIDKGDYRPDPFARTALDLAWHIAIAENRFYDTVISGRFNTDLYKRPETAKNPADAAAWYAETFEKNFQRLTQISGEPLTKIIDFRGALQLPAVIFLQIATNHSIHHRGQLATYLRPMGSKVPIIYGESYDSAEAKKVAQA